MNNETTLPADDLTLAQRYLPHFYADQADPFPIAMVGYQVLRASGKSPSFNRDIILPKGAQLAIEYAIFFDYDIQHMYDLEHAWVFVGPQGELVNAQSSTHGSYVGCMPLAGEPEEDTHLPLYLQPGKHAILPRGELFTLYTNYVEACGEFAGKDGLLVPHMLAGQMTKTPQIDAAIHRHIQANYRFVPTLQFQPARWEQTQLVTIPELLCSIPPRLNRLVQQLTADC